MQFLFVCTVLVKTMRPCRYSDRFFVFCWWSLPCRVRWQRPSLACFDTEKWLESCACGVLAKSWFNFKSFRAFCQFFSFVRSRHTLHAVCIFLPSSVVMCCYFLQRYGCLSLSHTAGGQNIFFQNFFVWQNIAKQERSTSIVYLAGKLRFRIE